MLAQRHSLSTHSQLSPFDYAHHHAIPSIDSRTLSATLTRAPRRRLSRSRGCKYGTIKPL